MNKLYNTQENVASDLAKFFEKVGNLSKPQLKIIPYITLGMIEAESVVTADLVKKLKGDFLKVYPSSSIRRLERFFNNPKFDVYELYDKIIRNMISQYKMRKKEVYITIDHMYCRDDFTILVFSMKIDKQRNTNMVQVFQRKKSIGSMPNKVNRRRNPVYLWIVKRKK